jgi:hypothetical protein
VKKGILFLLLLVLFQGCLNYQLEISLYPDGSGKMAINYWIEQPDSQSVFIAERMGLFEPDSIRQEFTSPYTVLEEVEVTKDTIEGILRARVVLSFNHIDSLNKAKGFKEYSFKLEDGASGQKILTQFIPPFATGFGIDPSAFTVTYIYTFSGEIITHNAHTIVGRKLTWSYTLDEIGNGKTISVTYRPYKLKETPYWIYVISGIVLILVVFFLFRKKKD